jgi:hypothetical protein
MIIALLVGDQRNVPMMQTISGREHAVSVDELE